jgi:hypothetical protein
MLVAGSETVRLIYDKQGRKEAIAFAQHIVTIASQQQVNSSSVSHSMERGGWEMGD